MKIFRTLYLSAVLVLPQNLAVAQQIPGAVSYHEQAFLFSNYDYTGSARIHGLGNAQISLGGDISSALSNPAGLGFYNRSEFSITPSYNVFTAKSEFLGNQTQSSLGKFNVDNFGAVFNKTKDDVLPGKWRGGSWAITFSKINEFNSNLQYQGMNPNNDILDYYVEDGNRQNVNPEDLAGLPRGGYYSYLMSEFLDAFRQGNDTVFVPFYERTFFSEFPSSQFPTNQSEVIASSGSQNQWSISYGGNFSDRYYIGAGLGIQSLRYNIVKEYSEIYPNLQGDIVSNSGLIEELQTEGIGVNGTIGFIGRPIDQMTIGFSLITPTFLSMSERYFYSTRASFNNFNMNNFDDYFDANYDLIVNPDALFTTFYSSTAILNKQAYSDESLFDYSVTTPLRINAGLSYFIQKSGFITADIEYVNFSNMRVKSSSGSLSRDQDIIKELYGSVLKVKVGGEWRLNSFRLRAGYNYSPNPYQVQGLDLTTQTYSAGLGFRSSKFFADLAASYRQFSNNYSRYILENPDNNPFYESPVVTFDNSNLNFILSMGLFF